MTEAEIDQELAPLSQAIEGCVKVWKNSTRRLLMLLSFVLVDFAALLLPKNLSLLLFMPFVFGTSALLFLVMQKWAAPSLYRWEYGKKEASLRAGEKLSREKLANPGWISKYNPPETQPFEPFIH